MKISILDKIVQKSQIWSKLSENLDFGQDFSKFSILAKTYQNVDFGEIEENVDFSQKFRKMSIWILKNLEICRYWLKLSKNLGFGHNCRKFSILVKIYQNVDFGHIWRKFWF